MANTLRFKRGLVSGIPTAALGEPLFTTDTFDLYIGNGTTNTRFQKYIASGTTSQLLRGDGSLLTMPIVLTSPASGQVLKFNGTNWVNDSDAGITGSGVSTQIAYFTGATTLASSNNFFWDNTNNRLNINTSGSTGSFTVNVRSSAAAILSLKGGASTNQGGALYITNANNSSTLAAFGDSANIAGGTPDLGAMIFTGTSIPLQFYVNGAERMRLFATGNLVINSTSDNGLRFQVTGDGYFSGLVGIGNSIMSSFDGAANNLVVGSGSGYEGITLYGGTTGGGSIYFADGTTGNQAYRGYIEYNHSTDAFAVGTSGQQRLVLGASGNLGLGVTPSAWQTTYRGLEVGATGSGIMSKSGESNLYLTSNAYYDTSAAWKYGYSDFASAYQQYLGKHLWYNAASGTAGNAITFTQAMTLDASGNLAVGTTNTDIFSRGDARNVVISATGASDNMSLQLNAGASGGRGSQIYMGAGGVRYFTIGTNVNETQIGTATSTPIIFYTNNGEKMRLFADGNLGIGTGNSNAGFKVDVNGTMRVSGASTFGDNATISKNQNAATILTLSNTTSAINSEVALLFTSSNGNASIGKFSATKTSYKTVLANDAYFYNATSGDISILNDVVTGAIKMAAGGSSTAHFTIASTGAATFSSSVTAASLIVSGSSTSSYIGSISQTNTTAGVSFGLLVRGGTNSSDIALNVQSAASSNLFRVFGDGQAIFSSSVTCSSLVVDSTTLVVDATNNRVGVGTNVPTSSLHVVGSVTKSHTTKTANYTLTESDYTVLCDTTSGGFTISLPAASGCSGRIYVIKKITGNSGTNNITIDPNGSETIDGSATHTLQCRSSVMIQSNGSNWWILAEKVDTSCL